VIRPHKKNVRQVPGNTIAIELVLLDHRPVLLGIDELGINVDLALVRE